MFKEFEGKTEKEAISKAMEDLHLKNDEFEVEILPESGKKISLFKRNQVRIRVHVPDEVGKGCSCGDSFVSACDEAWIQQCKQFTETVIQLMGYSGTVQLSHQEDGKVVLDIDTPDSAILIGKQGKNLDALQLILNAYMTHCAESKNEENHLPRIILDMQDYRHRREESIIRNALKSAEQVVRSKTSRLLEPMPAFERRLVHTALSDRQDVITQSEGEGSARQIRIIYKGSR